MNAIKVIKLPDAEEMAKRLTEVSDTYFLQEKFYPILLKHAGKKKSVEEIEVMIDKAIDAVAQELTPECILILELTLRKKYLAVLTQGF